METKTTPTIEPTLMKDQKSRKQAAGGFAAILAKLGLGGAGAGAASGGIVLGGTQAAAGGGLIAGLSANAGIVAATALASVLGIGVAAVYTGNAPEKIQSNRFFAKLGADSSSATQRAAERAREEALQHSGTDANGISSSLQRLVDANAGALGQLEGGEAAEGEAVADAANAAAQPGENTVQAPDNDWSAAAGKAAVGAKGRKEFKKASFKKGSAGASTQLAMGGPAAASGRAVNGAAPGGKLSGISATQGAASRSRSAVRGSKAVSRGAGPGNASGQARLTNQQAQAGLAGPASQSSYMDGSGSNAGTIGAGASQITGAGGGSEGAGNSSSIVNPVTSQNTSQAGAPPPPIKKKKDKTPYRDEMKVATAALILATGLLLIASLTAKDKNPATKAASLKTAKVLAGIAFAAAAVATFMGVIIMIEHKQMMQGGMFLASGGMLMLAAGKIVLTPEESDKDVAEGKADQEATAEAASDKAAGDGVTNTDASATTPDAPAPEVDASSGGEAFQSPSEANGGQIPPEGDAALAPEFRPDGGTGIG